MVRFFNSLVCTRRLRQHSCGYRTEIRLRGVDLQEVMPRVQQLRDTIEQELFGIRRVPIAGYLRMVRAYLVLCVERGMLSHLNGPGRLSQPQVFLLFLP
jgi:hypothetical protein